MTRDLARAAAESTVSVRFASGGYSIVVQNGLMERFPEMLARHAPAERYAVISDDRVGALYGGGIVQRCREAGIEVELFTFPAGEASKTRQQWSILTDQLLEAGLGRDAAVVALGGGVTGDLAGFVAATYMRGIPVVQVPTSLVAMIDSSVGGKTGVDVRAGKNLVGAFHPPSVVLVDPDVVRTLPEPERAQGLAEAVKHGAILDEAYFDVLSARASELLAGEPEATHETVLRSIELKAGVVQEDEREGGLRQILNFGHTLGHAIEQASGYAVGHGSAVAVGMLLEARLGEDLGLTESGTRIRLEESLRRFGLGELPSAGALDRSAVLRYIRTDKKARAGRPRFVLLERVGLVRRSGPGWSHEVEDAAVERVLDTLLAKALEVPWR